MLEKVTTIDERVVVFLCDGDLRFVFVVWAENEYINVKRCLDS